MITQKYLKSILHYNPKTGLFKWRDGCNHRKRVNEKGYLISFSLYYMTGKWPKDNVDHINCKPSDNRWVNLREADNQLNHYNLLKPKNNTSGVKGVRKVKSGYQARIKFNQKEIYLGIYPTLELASDAYLTKAKELAKEYANRGHS